MPEKAPDGASRRKARPRPGLPRPMRRSRPHSLNMRADAGFSPNMRAATGPPTPRCCSRRSPSSSWRCSGHSGGSSGQRAGRARGDERGDRAHAAGDRRRSSRRKPAASTATEELDNVVEATEQATSEILQAAEEIQEVAWTLREKGAEAELCDTLDQRATDIYTACSFQDITGQRTAKVVQGAALHRAAHQRHDRDLGGRRDRLQARGNRVDGGGRVEPTLFDSATGTALKQDDVDVMLQAAGETDVETGTGGTGSARRVSGALRTRRSRPGPSSRPSPLALARLDAIKRRSAVWLDDFLANYISGLD